MFLQQFYVESLGHYSYLIGSTEAGVAFVVDPKRDIADYIQTAQDLGLRITHILETHLHNDYVSGSRELAAASGAVIGHSAAAQLRYDHQPLREDDRLLFGELAVRVLETPGHTPEHLCYLVYDTKRSPTTPALIFSGGDLLVGSVGRPDLLGPELGAKLAPQLYDSLHHKILPVGDAVVVLPTHGAGSSCGAAISSTRTSTIGYEKATNPYLQHKDQAAFVRAILGNQPTIPAYYPRMRPINQSGPPLGAPPLPPSLDPAAFAARMAEPQTTVLDTRDAAAFGAGHIPGAINIGLDNRFTTWAGSTLPADDALLLVVAAPGDVTEALTQLHRIGLAQVAGVLTDGMAAWTAAGHPVATVPQISVTDLHAMLDAGAPVQVVDVRKADEWQAGHIAGAVHYLANRLADQAADLPDDRPLAVICGGGYRSSLAGSLLRRQGYTQVHNVTGGMEAWTGQGYPTEC